MRDIFVGYAGSPSVPTEEAMTVEHFSEDFLSQALEDNIFGGIVNTGVADEYPFLEPGLGRYFRFTEESDSVYGRHGLIGWVMRERVLGTMGRSPVHTPLEMALAREMALAQVEAAALRATVNTLVERVQNMERLLEDTNKMMLAMSQSYYWTPEWQAKEERADADAKFGRSKLYASVEDAIADLNK